MAYADLQDDEEQRRRMMAPASGDAPAPAVPSSPAPTPAQTPLGTQTDKGWMYPSIRPEPFQSELSPREVTEQQQEAAYRTSHAGQTLAADSASIRNAISQAQSGGTPPASRAPSSFDFSQMPGYQFDDPYTRQLEDLVRQNLQAIQQPQQNPALDQLTAFLNKQFTDLSTSPGYSPDELALIRTQMLEPIEADRMANRKRVEERTAARGFLPSSGLHEADLQQFVDQPAMEARTKAQRDIAMNAIQQRRSDIDRAMNVGSVAGIQIPGLQRAEDQGRRSEALNLSSLLYDLPNKAQQQAMSVINGTPGPEDLFNQSIQLQQAQQQQQQMNAQKWAQIGQLIAGLF